MNVQTQTFSYGEQEEDRLRLHNGDLFGPITLAYETFGELNADKSNAILLFHALSGSQHAAGVNPHVEGPASDGLPNAKRVGGMILSDRVKS